MGREYSFDIGVTRDITPAIFRSDRLRPRSTREETPYLARQGRHPALPRAAIITMRLDTILNLLLCATFQSTRTERYEQLRGVMGAGACDADASRIAQDHSLNDDLPLIL